MTKPWTAREAALVPIFERALKRRDQGNMQSACLMLQHVASRLSRDDRRLLLQTELQLGYVHKQLNQPSESAAHFRTATQIAPTSELASLALYHSLWANGLYGEAGGEMLRFVTLRDSGGYRELLSEGYGLDLPSSLLIIVIEVRRLLREYAEHGEPRERR